MKSKIIIALLLCIIIAPVIVTAGWQIHSSWSVKDENAYPVGITTNSTDTQAGDFWIVEANDRKVYHYGPTGTYIENFSTLGKMFNKPYYIAINWTVGKPVSLYVTDQASEYVTVFTEAGVGVKNFTLPDEPLLYMRGLVSNWSNESDKTYWTLDNINNKLVKLNKSMGILSSCSISSFADDYTFGLATNSTNSTVNAFWTVDFNHDAAYRFDQNCALQATIDLGSLGIDNPYDIETYYRKTDINDLLVMDGVAKKVYRLTYVNSFPGFSGQATSNAEPHYTNTSQLSVTCTDDVDIQYAYLATNQTGVWQNYTNGEYGSPLTYAGVSNTSVLANFTWNNSIASLRSNVTVVAWKVGCVDDTAQWNYSTELDFNATPIKYKCYNASIGFSTTIFRSTENISFVFNNTGNTVCAFWMEARGTAITNVSCPYKVSLSNRTHVYNTSTDLCVVNATMTNIGAGAIALVEISSEISESGVSNVPIAIAAAAATGIIIIISVAYRRRRSQT